jgi:hypothetical protein
LGVPQGSILGPLFFLLYINDLPAITNDVSKPTLFADDISSILTTAHHRQLKKSFTAVLGKIMHWFQTNFFTLNINKTYCMYFTTKMSQTVNFPVKYINTQINSTHCILFRPNNGFGIVLARTYKQSD